MTSTIHATFNGPIELGTRSSLILTALDKQFSLDDLVLLDYALLYSQDFGGPENLHPALPNHIAEIGHRREFLPGSLAFFSKRGLISVNIEETGYYYSANQQTLHFVSCLKSEYYRKSWVRLGWLKDNYNNLLEQLFPKFNG